MMTRILLFLICATASTAVWAQKSGWTTKERQDFQKSCNKEIGNSLTKIDRKHVQEFCVCYTDRLEKMFPEMEQLVKASEDKVAFRNQCADKALDCWTDIALKYPKTGEALAEYQPKLADRVTKDTNLTVAYTPKMKQLFVQRCVSEAGKDKQSQYLNATQYCTCMWDKIQVRFPNYRDFVALERKGTQVFIAELKTEINECVALSAKKTGNYPTAFTDAYLKNCLKTYKKDKRIKAEPFCTCMLEKMQAKFPNYADLEKVIDTPEGEGSLPEVMREDILQCIEGARK
jgi:hypothetical protein